MPKVKFQFLRNLMNSQKSPNSYQPKEIESQIYQICKDRGYFEINGNQTIQKPDKFFSMMMPPPNVTGVLHIGHALTLTLQDIIARYKRMDGFKTLYQPGLDHAGIATQNIVEKQLLAKGIKKEDIGREAFVTKIWEWKEKSGGQIISQMERLGITASFSRTRFTMDKGLQNAVRKAFVSWYDRGLIVQGNYMVNWCTHDGALSDIEVEYHQKESKLYHLKYPIKGSSECLILATTRPETYFGDTAVMVHPEDKRYSHLIGKTALLPLTNKEIPIICDSYVDMTFGTGCVKVTPAHDINDYEVGKRHSLASVVVFDKNGILNKTAGEFAGLERLEAREKIVSKLAKEGFVEKIEEYSNQVGHCYRCGNIIEPYISKQWFVKAEVAKEAIKKVNDGLVRFFPPQWKNNYDAWMRDLRDWCISRQLWWGHRIPVWTCECSHQFASEEETPQSCPKCASSKITQDPDVLDTWFSSGLWAFSTLGWGNGDYRSEEDANDKHSRSKQTSLPKWQEEDLANFYPNSLLITGFDILFFWVARMILSGESLLGKLPFKDIYLHALIRDENGQKMSKSKGNVIDPIKMIESYGADTLRFTLAMLCSQGRDIRLSIASLEISKNFANKLFNATNFLLMYAEQLNEGKNFDEQENLQDFKTPLGKYAKSRLNCAVKETREAIENYRFNDGASILYRFLWGEFCDWFIELAKADKQSIYELGSVILEALKLLHPYMPFLSEDLWHKLRKTSLSTHSSIMIATYPIEITQDKNIEAEFELIKDAIVSIRRVKMLLDIGNKQIPNAFIRINRNIENVEMLKKFVAKLAKVTSVEITAIKPTNCVCDVSQYCESYLSLEEIDLHPIKKRLQSQKDKFETEVLKLSTMLNNKNFVQNAPKEVLTNTQKNFEDAQKKLSQIKEEYEKINQF